MSQMCAAQLAMAAIAQGAEKKQALRTKLLKAGFSNRKKK